MYLDARLKKTTSNSKDQITVDKHPPCSVEATQAVNSGDLVDQAWAKFIIVHQCSVVDTESCPAVTGGNGPNVNRANVAQGRSGSVCWLYSVSAM